MRHSIMDGMKRISDQRILQHNRKTRAIEIAEICKLLAQGGRVFLVIRHAERPPLENGDATFGENLPLTVRGMMEAVAFGMMFKKHCGNIVPRFFHGGNVRCRRTADLLATEWHSNAESVRRRLPALGGESPYLGDVAARLALAETGDYMAAKNAYFREGRQRGFNRLPEATAEFERTLFAATDARFAFFVTHDLNVACYMAGRGVRTRFDETTWPGFLDAVVVLQDTNGATRYGEMRRPSNRA